MLLGGTNTYNARTNSVSDLFISNCTSFKQEPTGQALPRGVKYRQDLLTSLKTCCSTQNLQSGKKYHAEAVRNGHESNIYVSNLLMTMYFKCGSIENAHSVFDGMFHRDIGSWNTLMMGYVATGEYTFVLDLFGRMKASSGYEPNGRSFLAALMASAGLAAKEEPKLDVSGRKTKPASLQKLIRIHAHGAKRGYDSGNVFVGSALIDGYTKCGCTVEAEKVFYNLLHRDVACWNALMMGYVENGESKAALELLYKMDCTPNPRTYVAALAACAALATAEAGSDVHGKLVKSESLKEGVKVHMQAERSGCCSNVFVACSLINMYTKCGSMGAAWKVFCKMKHRDNASWNAMLTGYVENGESNLTLELFARMEKPDARSYVSALVACGNMVALEHGRKLHAEVRKKGLEKDRVLATALLDFYGKCGQMNEAELVFNSIQCKDAWMWNVLISGYSQQSDIMQVLDCVQRMRDGGHKPDSVTFLCMLTACSQGGLIEEGRKYFDTMQSVYGIAPGIQHYTCIIDMLSRANRLEEAVSVARTMPFEVDAAIWRAILSACRKWRNVAIGELAFESLLRLGNVEATAYVLMADIYGSVGMLEKQAEVLALNKRV